MACKYSQSRNVFRSLEEARCFKRIEIHRPQVELESNVAKINARLRSRTPVGGKAWMCPVNMTAETAVKSATQRSCALKAPMLRLGDQVQAHSATKRTISPQPVTNEPSNRLPRKGEATAMSWMTATVAITSTPTNQSAFLSEFTMTLEWRSLSERRNLGRCSASVARRKVGTGRLRPAHLPVSASAQRFHRRDPLEESRSRDRGFPNA